ncbi:MAG: hypothetical protein KF851_08370 [Pirellulaceae bacterium]|nr:hypothetical protein [Pirellulaceae bacterium]
MAAKKSTVSKSTPTSTKTVAVKKAAKVAAVPPAKKSAELPKRTRKKVGAERQTAEKRPSQKSLKKVAARASKTRAGSTVRSASGKRKANTVAAARRTKRGKKRAT